MACLAEDLYNKLTARADSNNKRLSTDLVDTKLENSRIRTRVKGGGASEILDFTH